MPTELEMNNLQVILIFLSFSQLMASLVDVKIFFIFK